MTYARPILTAAGAVLGGIAVIAPVNELVELGAEATGMTEVAAGDGTDLVWAAGDAPAAGSIQEYAGKAFKAVHDVIEGAAGFVGDGMNFVGLDEYIGDTNGISAQDVTDGWLGVVDNTAVETWNHITNAPAVIGEAFNDQNRVGTITKVSAGAVGTLAVGAAMPKAANNVIQTAAAEGQEVGRLARETVDATTKAVDGTVSTAGNAARTATDFAATATGKINEFTQSGTKAVQDATNATTGVMRKVAGNGEVVGPRTAALAQQQARGAAMAGAGNGKA